MVYRRRSGVMTNLLRAWKTTATVVPGVSLVGETQKQPDGFIALLFGHKVRRGEAIIGLLRQPNHAFRLPRASAARSQPVRNDTRGAEKLPPHRRCLLSHCQVQNHSLLQ